MGRAVARCRRRMPALVLEYAADAPLKYSEQF
jgi:hypothetical protein